MKEPGKCEARFGRAALAFALESPLESSELIDDFRSVRPNEADLLSNISSSVLGDTFQESSNLLKMLKILNNARKDRF